MLARSAPLYVSSIGPRVMLFAFPLFVLPNAVTTFPMMVTKLLHERRYLEVVGFALLSALSCAYWWWTCYRTKRIALIEGHIVVSSPWAEETIPVQNVSDVCVTIRAHPRVAIHFTQATQFGNPVYFIPKWGGALMGADNPYVVMLKKHIWREPAAPSAA